MPVKWVGITFHKTLKIPLQTFSDFSLLCVYLRALDNISKQKRYRKNKINKYIRKRIFIKQRFAPIWHDFMYFITGLCHIQSEYNQYYTVILDFFLLLSCLPFVPYTFYSVFFTYYFLWFVLLLHTSKII